jgi:hypothetical protein
MEPIVLALLVSSLLIVIQLVRPTAPGATTRSA